MTNLRGVLTTVLILSLNLSVLAKIKASGIVKLIFSELLMFFGKSDRSFPKTAKKPPESPSTSGSINTAGSVTSRCDLHSGDEELVNIFHDLHESQGVTAKKSPKSVNGRLNRYFCSKTVFNLSRKFLAEYAF